MLGAGSVIAGKYRLESPIGRGGMGAVWRATHLTLGRAVAVKTILGDAPTDDTLQRFLREARGLAAVRHRHVVDVLDFGLTEGDGGGRPFLVMECLEGESLAARLERAPAPTLAEIAEWVSGALGGLGAIHDAGLVHRDLKPANIFLARDADGVIPKVLDFGIARMSDGEAATLTHSMQTLGTPHYMSPEQVRSAKTVDARSDIFAMGVILYEALTGRLPFDGPSVTAVIAAIVTDEPAPVSSLRPDLPAAVVDVVHRAIARDPAQRFPDARAMREALSRAVRGESGTAALAAGSPHVVTMRSAPTVPATAVGGSAAGFSGTSRARTGRRGFFAIFGMLSTLLVVGLGGAATYYSLAGTRAETMASAVPSGGGIPEAEEAPMPSSGARSPVPAAPAEPAPSVAPAPMPTTAPVGAGEPRFVSATLPLAELAVRVRHLWSDQRGCVRVAPRDEGWAAFAIAACEAHVPALRAALGGQDAGAPDAAQLAAGLEPVLLRTAARANVRDAPGTEVALRATLPEDALVVGFYGAVGEQRSEDGGRGTWTRIVAAQGVEGWMASSLLRPWEHCVPRAGDVGGPGVVVAWARLGADGRPEREGDGLVLFQPPGSLRIARVSPSCEPTEVHEVSLSGRAIEELFVTRTAPQGGETLVVVGARAAGARGASGAMAWDALRLGEPRPVWSIELRSSQTLPDGRRDQIGGPFLEGPDGAEGFWPLRVRRMGGERVWYRWDGATLVAP